MNPAAGFLFYPLLNTTFRICFYVGVSDKSYLPYYSLLQIHHILIDFRSRDLCIDLSGFKG